jgi:hypothetical protein
MNQEIFIQKLIMNGYCPGQISIHDITNRRSQMLWKEQEAVFVR